MEHGPGRKLLHVLSSNQLGSMACFASDVIQTLGAEYSHTVVYPAGDGLPDQSVMMNIQMSADFLGVADINCMPGVSAYSAAIVYDQPQGACQLPIPTIYYAYSGYNPDVRNDVLVAPCAYAACLWRLSPDYIMPPAVRSRMLRRVYLGKDAGPFTVGVVSSNNNDRYPLSVVTHLQDNLPKSWRLLCTDHPQIRTRKASRQTWLVPRMLDATIKVMQMSQVLIYAHDNYTPAYGRLCLELLASGVPVICQRSGAPAALYRDGVELTFFDTPEEIVPIIESLRQWPAAVEALASNAQLRASWEDLSIHVGTLKGILRKLGA